MQWTHKHLTRERHIDTARIQYMYIRKSIFKYYIASHVWDMYFIQILYIFEKPLSLFYIYDKQAFKRNFVCSVLDHLAPLSRPKLCSLEWHLRGFEGTKLPLSWLPIVTACSNEGWVAGYSRYYWVSGPFTTPVALRPFPQHPTSPCPTTEEISCILRSGMGTVAVICLHSPKSLSHAHGFFPLTWGVSFHNLKSKNDPLCSFWFFRCIIPFIIQ